MESLGEYLQNIRKQKGLGIDQIAEKTRINPHFIRALEQERFEQFPGETFAKGFVRSYARSLGLDELDVLRRFKESSSEFYSQSFKREREIAIHQEKETRKKVFVSRALQGAILLFIGISVWFVHDLNSPRVKPSDPFLASTPSGPNSDFQTPAGEIGLNGEHGIAAKPFNTDPDAGQTGLPEERSVESATSQVLGELSTSVNLPEGVVPPGQVGDPLILRIEAVEESWIYARIDGIETKEVFLRVGEKVVWRASEKFVVDFGNAGGVTVSLDGETIPELGESGQVKKGVLFTRE